MTDPSQYAECGRDVSIYPGVVVVHPENLHLKSHIIVSEFCWLHSGIKTVIGNYVHVSYFSSIAGGGVCIVEDFAGLSAGVRLVTGSEMIGGEGLTNPTVPAEFRAVTRSFVHLQKHAFLASDVVGHPGVTVGEGAVVGSNSVVTKDLEPWTINRGSPAAPVGTRDPEKMRILEARVYERYGVRPFDPTPFLVLKKITHRIPEI